jgi:hypothetical protein
MIVNTYNRKSSVLLHFITTLQGFLAIRYKVILTHGYQKECYCKKRLFIELEVRLSINMPYCIESLCPEITENDPLNYELLNTCSTIIWSIFKG